MAVKSKKTVPVKAVKVEKIINAEKENDEENSDLEDDENDSYDEELNDEEDGPIPASKKNSTKKMQKPANVAKGKTGQKEAKPGAGAVKDMTLSQRDQRSVFMKRVKSNTTEKDMIEFFARVGKVVKIRFVRNKSIALVLFEKENVVDKAVALNKTVLNGKTVLVERCKPSLGGKDKKKSRESKKKAKKRDTGGKINTSHAKKQKTSDEKQPALKKEQKLQQKQSPKEKTKQPMKTNKPKTIKTKTK